MAEIKLKNSFLDVSAKGQKVLVIVPHEDDEINVAGSVMYSYVQKGADVYCVFTTNGDYSFWARTRMHEAWRSLQTLGVQHVIFLGYGDTSNHYPGGHWFYSPEEAVTAPSGHNETYGCNDFPDYAFAKRGIHRPYCRQSIKTDLKDLMDDIRADIIFAVDADVHIDHRATSILFEEALGELLCRPGNTYNPIVFKGFLYTEKHAFEWLPADDKRPSMHIGFNINDPFFKPLGAEITSILETNKDIAFHFHVFVDSYSPENKDNLEKTAKKYGCNIYLYVMDMSIYQNFHIKVARFSRVTYIRIVMPWILRHYTDHYLYLDSDMICVGSLKQFLTTDLEGKAIGALTYHTPDRVAFLKMKQDVYFSDGLMWIDVNEWIREKITERVFSYQGADPRRFKGQTQDLLNLVIDGNMKPIPNLFHHKIKILVSKAS